MGLSDSKITVWKFPQRSRNDTFIWVQNFSISINTEQAEHLWKWIFSLVRKYEGCLLIIKNFILIYIFIFFGCKYLHILFSDKWKNFWKCHLLQALKGMKQPQEDKWFFLFSLKQVREVGFSLDSSRAGSWYDLMGWVHSLHPRLKA